MCQKTFKDQKKNWVKKVPFKDQKKNLVKKLPTPKKIQVLIPSRRKLAQR